jgi:hypothetical protein
MVSNKPLLSNASLQPLQCGKRYRLRTTLSFTTAHLFSTNSFHTYLEFLTIFLTVRGAARELRGKAPPRPSGCSGEGGR